MIIKDIVMFVPNALISSLLKTVRVNIDDVGKQEILKNGLYHITKDEETSDKIIKSQHLRPATGIMKNINSYGIACIHMFNGAPSVDNYIKNLVNDQSRNPYVNPTIVANAIKIFPTRMEELDNYKVRALEDNAIIYEGYCVLPEEEVQKVYLVPDLVRNSETGEPIKNLKTGRYDIAFREAKQEELKGDKKTYMPQEDYLQFMEEERKRLGYLKKHNFITNSINTMRTALHIGRIEGEMAQENAVTNFQRIIKRKIKQFMTPKLNRGTDEKIQNTISEFNSKKKNPYRDKKFGEAVAEFQTQGLKQLELKQELESLTTSDTGKYFRQKYNQIDKNPIIEKGIHGISHNNRVATLSMIIAQREGILEEDLDDRTKDILLSAAYYHDIGRKKGIITDNYGPHSKNSASKINKMDLFYANGEPYSTDDKKILQAVVQAHEGNDKNMIKICKKYKIREENIPYTMQLMTILKDSDALDRVRLDINFPILMRTDLNPEYLRTNTAKQLLNASYQLETLSRRVDFDRIIAYKTNEQKDCGIIESKREQFIDGLRQGITEIPQTMHNLKKTLKLKKEKSVSRLTNIGKRLKELSTKKEVKEEQEIK